LEDFQERPTDRAEADGEVIVIVELVLRPVIGIAMHIGARVAANAHPGEVVVSSTVKDLVVGSGIQFVDRGTQILKGVLGEWRLFAVRQ
jgi:class 3 adenylate cyclase